jgi:dTDP-4-amino-4,6-dideoxygalactose transaminase
MTDTALPPVPFFRPSLGVEEENAVLEVMRSGWLTTGKVALEFEKEFAAFVGSASNARPCHALAVNSATSGLLLAMEVCGIAHDTAILTTPYTFASTAIPALQLGGNIVYADIEADSYNIAPTQIEKKLKEHPEIKAIIPVHIAGNVCDMTAIRELSVKYRVPIIEDAAHAFPSLTENGYAGTLGDIGVFSFYATKTITTGEGGMLCLRSGERADEFAKRLMRLRLHGIDRPVWDRYTSNKASWEYDVVEAGWKCNMPDILAAIGREQLKKAQAFLESRRAVAQKYNEAFAAYDFLRLPPDGPGNAWQLYLLRIVPEKLNIDRNTFSDMLQEKGIGVSMHFIPHFRLTVFQNRCNIKATDFPNALRQFETTISLPLWPGMPDDMADRVIQTVIEIGKAHYGR